MTAACRTAGLPEPELEKIGSRFRVTLRCKLDTAIVELLRRKPGASTSQIVVATGSSTQAPRKEHSLKQGCERGVNLREFLEGKARNLCDDVIKARLEARGG